MQTSSSEKTSPWYKHPWIWFVGLPLGLSVIGVTGMALVSVKLADDVITDNYYKEGLAINQHLEQDARAQELGLYGQLKFDLQLGDVVLTLKGAQQPMPTQLLLLLDHPTSADQDLKIVLNQQLPGRYSGELQKRVDYRWYVRVLSSIDADNQSGAEWRLQGELNFAETDSLYFLPR